MKKLLPTACLKQRKSLLWDQPPANLIHGEVTKHSTIFSKTPYGSQASERLPRSHCKIIVFGLFASFCVFLRSIGVGIQQIPTWDCLPEGSSLSMERDIWWEPRLSRACKAWFLAVLAGKFVVKGRLWQPSADGSRAWHFCRFQLDPTVRGSNTAFPRRHYVAHPGSRGQESTIMAHILAAMVCIYLASA